MKGYSLDKVQELINENQAIHYYCSPSGSGISTDSANPGSLTETLNKLVQQSNITAIVYLEDGDYYLDKTYNITRYNVYIKIEAINSGYVTIYSPSTTSRLFYNSSVANTMYFSGLNFRSNYINSSNQKYPEIYNDYFSTNIFHNCSFIIDEYNDSGNLPNGLIHTRGGKIILKGTITFDFNLNTAATHATSVWQKLPCIWVQLAGQFFCSIDTTVEVKGAMKANAALNIVGIRSEGNSDVKIYNSLNFIFDGVYNFLCCFNKFSTPSNINIVMKATQTDYGYGVDIKDSFFFIQSCANFFIHYQSGDLTGKSFIYSNYSQGVFRLAYGISSSVTFTQNTDADLIGIYNSHVDIYTMTSRYVYLNTYGTGKGISLYRSFSTLFFDGSSQITSANICLQVYQSYINVHGFIFDGNNQQGTGIDCNLNSKVSLENTTIQNCNIAINCSDNASLTKNTVTYSNNVTSDQVIGGDVSYVSRII